MHSKVRIKTRAFMCFSPTNFYFIVGGLTQRHAGGGASLANVFEKSTQFFCTPSAG